ncbi:scavenger receptor cysteine-rich domain-containing protein DMBT1-like [Glandiceps talaboti]
MAILAHLIVHFLLFMLSLMCVPAQIQGNGGPYVRLVGDSTPYAGRVEIFIPGDGWLHVCKNGWDINDAEVACTELGFPGAMRSWKKDDINSETEKVLTRIDCSNEEASILNCSLSFQNSCNTAACARCNYDSYLGCYDGLPDILSPPIITKTSDSMTIQFCLEFCRMNGTTYAGLNNAKNCYCIHSFTQLQNLPMKLNKDCATKTCKGDSSQSCGGKSQIAAVYSTTMGACGGYINGSGTIYSPGFPGYYGENLGCTWNITTTPGMIVQLEFITNDIVGENDGLYVFEGTDPDGGNIVTFSNGTAWSCSNNVSVVFHSETRPDADFGMFTLQVKGIKPGCLLPLYPKEGILVIDGDCPYFHGESVSVVCKDGYHLTTSHNTVQCQENGGWNDVFPLCKVIDCGDPGNTDNADREGHSFTYRNQVKYVCHDGYHNDNDGIITCQEDGLWTKKPSCYKNVNFSDFATLVFLVSNIQ